MTFIEIGPTGILKIMFSQKTTVELDEEETRRRLEEDSAATKRKKNKAIAESFSAIVYRGSYVIDEAKIEVLNFEGGIFLELQLEF
jgi:hypothetical protein